MENKTETPVNTEKKETETKEVEVKDVKKDVKTPPKPPPIEEKKPQAVANGTGPKASNGVKKNTATVLDVVKVS